MTMASREIIQKRLTYWEGVYEKLQEAYLALVEGGVKSYTINDRSITKFDIPNLLKQIEEVERKIDELTSMLEGAPTPDFHLVSKGFFDRFVTHRLWCHVEYLSAFRAFSH